MFKHLNLYDQIYVVGPQRSGTTICATMIANDTDRKVVRGEQIFVNSVEMVHNWIKWSEPRSLVFQCPGITRYIHTVATERDLVVLMKRPVNQIIASQERINWDGEAREMHQYIDAGVNMERPIAQIKYGYFHDYQKHIIPHVAIVHYESLREHPLWIENREGFVARQVL